MRLQSAAILVASLLATGIETPALAQVGTGPISEDASEKEAGNETIVTARKQKELLQDVRVAITVIRKETLGNFRIDEAGDLASRIPALAVKVGGSGASASIEIRGVGS